MSVYGGHFAQFQGGYLYSPMTQPSATPAPLTLVVHAKIRQLIMIQISLKMMMMLFCILLLCIVGCITFPDQTSSI